MLLAAVAVIVLVALASRSKVEPQMPAAPSPARSPTSVPTAPSPAPATKTQDPTSGWLEHNDRVLNFSVRYPSGWFLYPAKSVVTGGSTILASFDVERASPDETAAVYQAEGAKIEFGNHPVPYDGSQDLRRWALENFFQSRTYAVGAEFPVDIGTFHGVRLKVTDDDGLTGIVFLIPRGKTVFIASGVPANPQVDIVLSTLRLW